MLEWSPLGRVSRRTTGQMLIAECSRSMSLHGSGEYMAIYCTGLQGLKKTHGPVHGV